MADTLSTADHNALVSRIKKIPITDALKLRMAALERGSCTLEMDRDLRYNGIFDSIHGGILATLADSAAAFAILTVTGAKARITTIEMNTRFLRPALGRVAAKARVLKAGKSLAFCSVEIAGERGELLVDATVTYMILRPK
ncbi:MAG TPA: PaaI family thioesterase [Planctomycetota bacterium]|jgi:uncharacterized protein (TIGR00369 family)